MLTCYRRHLESCAHKSKGREHTKCQCPIHCDGIVNGRRIRESMDTVNWARAVRRAANLEDEVTGDRVRKSVGHAAEAFLKALDVRASTRRKYNRIMARLGEFAEKHAIVKVDQFSLEHLDAYRESRAVNALSWSKELQLLRSFFGFCSKRKWCQENPACDMDMPSDPRPAPREPYTAAEITRILAACDTFGKAPYERLRAKAMILLMRKYGLRVSDVATLERSRVSNGQIFCMR